MKIHKKAKIETRSLECILTQEEINKRAEEMAHAVQEKNKVQQEKKEAMSGFKLQIEEQESIIQNSSNAINNGKEPRDIDCEIELNTPKSGMKQITRTDTGEVWAEDMTPAELQEEIFN